MKPKVYILAFLVGLALTFPVQLDAHPVGGGGGGGGGGGHSFSGGGGGGHGAPSRMAGYRGGMYGYRGGMYGYRGGMYGYRGGMYGHYYGGTQFNRAGQFNRSGQFSQAGQFSRSGQVNRSGQFNRTGQSNHTASTNGVGRTATVGPHMSNGHLNAGGSHIVATHSASWHSNWSHNHDHFWHGHNCRFVNGSWIVFDAGFYDPFWWGYPYWGYGYPYGYGYGYGGYPYDDGAYYGDDSQQVYPGQDAGDYKGSDNGNYEYNDTAHHGNGSPVAIAQSRLARLGYYHGAIDGVMGPETRQAVTDYQRDHGLHVTGAVTADTLHSMNGNQ